MIVAIEVGSPDWMEYWARWYGDAALRSWDRWERLPPRIKEEFVDQTDVWFYLLMSQWWKYNEPWAATRP